MGWPVLRSLRRDNLLEAKDPFRAEDGLPDCRQLDRQHNDAGQQRYREQQPILVCTKNLSSGVVVMKSA
jgi:hypothetical protein